MPRLPTQWMVKPEERGRILILMIPRNRGHWSCVLDLDLFGSQRRSCHYPARSDSCIPLSFFPSTLSVVMSRMNFYHVLFVTWLGKWPAREGGFAYGPLLDYQTWSNLVQIEPRWNNLEEIYPQSGTLLSTRLWIILRFFGLILEAI